MFREVCLPRRRCRVVIFGMVLAILTLTFSPAQGMQVGAQPTGDTAWELYARTHMTEPSFRTNGTYGRFYWIGITFPDGWFIQTGYMDSSDQYSDLCQTGFSTFTTVLHNNQWVSGYGTYNPTNCNLTGDHNFQIKLVNASASGTSWRALMDGSPIGPQVNLPAADLHFHRNQILAISEIANCQGGGCPLDAGTPFATVRYGPAIQYMNGSDTSWHEANHAYARVAGPSYNCNWFTEYLVAADDFKSGKVSNLPSTPCYADFASLW